ncbi:MAG: DUF4037 domain-containing protein [Gemmatimonadetes bacterium]|nr:DUF4037 domain-containing protein [Gemmatimonadota bacterium]
MTAQRVRNQGLDPLVHRLLPLVRGFGEGPCGIALGGSWAKGVADEHSDLDLYLFCNAVQPPAHREAMVAREFGPAADPRSWGADVPFEECGTDWMAGSVRVECWMRNAGDVERTIDACGQGTFARTLSVWAVMGFFSYVALSDVRAMDILEDPDGRLARWKSLVDPYPEPLRAAVLTRFVAEAAFWPRNPHYASAVERADSIYTSAIVQQTVHAVLQAVFALNREYFPGEKKLAGALGALRSQPAATAARLDGILFPGAASVDMLRAQRRALTELVDEVAALARAS